MTSFSIKIKNPYDESYDGIIKTYDWLVKSLRKIGVENEKIRCELLFRTGKITCSVESIDEFRKYAYGTAEYSFISGSIVVHDKENTLFDSIHIILFINEVTISTCDKVLLTKIDESLNQTIESTESNIKAINQYNVSGNNIAIANDNSNATVVSESPKANVNNSKNQNETKKESGFKSFVKGIFNNIVSNIIWYILGILFAGSSLALLFSHIFK